MIWIFGAGFLAGWWMCAATWPRDRHPDLRRAALVQPEPQGPKLIYRYNPTTIAECGGPCEQGPQYCDCGQIKGEPEPQGPTDEELYELLEESGFESDRFARVVLARWGRPAVEPEPGNG